MRLYEINELKNSFIKFWLFEIVFNFMYELNFFDLIIINKAPSPSFEALDGQNRLLNKRTSGRLQERGNL